ncbi:MAG: hypothetical protein KKA28_17865 [Planctomycetes bacterium]|nr:hypothetical protein [Planctomycetota bacterium]MCG2685288.1 hypothetical protein [Planctomycetales bacterium]
MEDFVTAYAKSKSTGEVADKLGMSTSSVHVRASTLRKSGVRLKRFPRGRRTRLDVAALNELLGRLGALDDAPETPQTPSRRAVRRPKTTPVAASKKRR